MKQEGLNPRRDASILLLALALAEVKPRETLEFVKAPSLYEFPEIPLQPARSRFLPGDPQPWKRRGKR